MGHPPDPAGGGAVVLANPQTWNRYAYVANNPLRLVDPLGLSNDPCADLSFWGDGFCVFTDDSGGGGGGSGGGNTGYGGYTWDQTNDLWWNATFSAANSSIDLNAWSNVLDAMTFGNGGGYTEADYAAQVAAAFGRDPCVYLNDAGTGVESVDQNSNPGECREHKGQWIDPQPSGTIYGVDANGNAYAYQPFNPDAAIIFSMVSNSFPGWLTANYSFSPRTCWYLGAGGVFLSGVGVYAANPIVVGAGIVVGGVAFMGCS